MKTCPYCGSNPRYDCPVEWRCGSVSDVYRSRDCLQKEIGLLKERVKRLEEAGDAMHRYCDAISALKWEKAKETNP